MRVRFLGTGTSSGIPVIGCDCAVCTSPDPRDQRTRCSIYLEVRDRKILVDTTPELRLQAVAAGIKHLDAVLYTHAHADHIYGLDDLRSLNHMTGRRVPCYGALETLASLRRAFAYVFEPGESGGGKPRIDLHPIDGILRLGDVAVEPIPVVHGQMSVLAFRFGAFAYATDASEVPAASRDRLRGLDTLVLDALQERPHPAHLTIDQALEVIADVAPRRAYLVHMSHRVSHVEVSARLPAGVALAHDGLEIEVPDVTVQS